MRLGLRGRDAAALLVGVLLGCFASRQILPTPAVLHVSLTVSCGGAHEVTVPFASNAAWGVQSGNQWWDVQRRAWAPSARWHAGPGKMIVGPSSNGVRLVVQAPLGGQVAGATVKAVLSEEKAK